MQACSIQTLFYFCYGGDVEQNDIVLGQEAVHPKYGVGRIIAIEMVEIVCEAFSSKHNRINMLTEQNHVGFAPYGGVLENIIKKGYDPVLRLCADQIRVVHIAELTPLNK